MGFFEKLVALLSIPKILENLTCAIRTAQKSDPTQSDREIRVRAEVRFTDTEIAERNSNQKEQTSIQRSIRNAAWFASAAGITYAGISCNQWVEMKKQTVAANRAWISPFAANLAADPQIKRLQVEVLYLNVGKSPAQFLNWRAKIKVVPTPADGDLSKIKIVNSYCDDLMPNDKTGGVNYPGTSRSDAFLKEFPSDPPIFVDDNLVQGKTTPYIYGCVAYRTLNIVGRSGFCFLFSKRKPDGGPEGVTAQCPIGDRAE